MKAHQVPISELLQNLDSSSEGISDHEVKIRQEKYGRNELKQKRRTSVLILFLRQFWDFMILILGAAAVISGFLGDLTDSIIILAIILLNAIIGFYQEYSAEKEMESLKKISVTHAHVIRNGKLKVIPSEELVPGDVSIITAGDMIAADMRLIEN
jgi:Ca2+-transporting ATPase